MKPAENTPLSWSEDRLQQEVIYRWRKLKYKPYWGCLFSVPNGGLRGGYEAKVLKSTGVFGGVSDLIFLFNSRAYLLELKRPDGKGTQQPNQKYWQELMENQGFIYLIKNDIEDIMNFLDNIIRRSIENY